MNVTDKLYSEWAWRSKTGAPDINNPEDKVILDNLIAELTGEKSLSGKEKLIQLINNTNLSDDQIERIERGIINIGYKDDVTILLKDKGFTEDSFKSKGALDSIFNQLADTDLTKVLEYLKNPVKLPPGKHKITELTGLSADIIHSIFGITPGADADGNTIGPGEIGLGLLFSNTKNKSGGGDLEWNGTKLEVKKNEGRFGGQGSRIPMLNPLEFLVKDIFKGNTEIIQKVYSLPKNKNMTHAIANITKVAKEEGINLGLVLKDVRNVIDQLYYNQGFADKYITSDILESPAKLKKAIFKVYTHSYMQKNKIDSLLFWNPNNLEYLIFDKSKVDSVIDNREIDTSMAIKTDPELGFRWKDTAPKLYFL